MMNLLRFENPDFVYLFFLLPVFGLAFWYLMRWKKRRINQFGDPEIVQQLIPQRSKNRPLIKFFLWVFAFFWLIIALINPQTGSKLENVKREGIDLIIALDVSNSMMAEDIAPNRLQAARLAISKLIDKLGGDRIGLVVFAGKAYVQLPLTTDYAAAKLFLSNLSTDMVAVQGTAIGQAIDLAASSFSENDHTKAIVVITDGENHEDDAVGAAAKAFEAGIQTYTIGMGSNEGTPIPEYNRQGIRTGYKKDNKNETVITRLNENMLVQIAASGNGSYTRANNTSAVLEKVFSDINELEKTEIESRIFTDYEDRFQFFIALSILFLTLELFLFERKTIWSERLRFFER